MGFADRSSGVVMIFLFLTVNSERVRALIAIGGVTSCSENSPLALTMPPRTAGP